MRCRRCGMDNRADEYYCRGCGRPITLPPLAPAAQFLPVWPGARSTLLRGLAALLLGTAVELLRRRLARRAASALPVAANVVPPKAAVASPAVHLLADFLDRPKPRANGTPQEEQITEIVYYRQVRRRG